LLAESRLLAGNGALFKRGGQPDTNFVYFYHPDHLGNTSYATDGEGELYEHVQYFPSGELWVDQRSNTERLPYLFSSKELDQETRLYAFGARYYDPRVELWSSADPAQTATWMVHPQAEYTRLSISRRTRT
jgi:RHS repeat-associated protein